MHRGRSCRKMGMRSSTSSLTFTASCEVVVSDRVDGSLVRWTNLRLSIRPFLPPVFRHEPAQSMRPKREVESVEGNRGLMSSVR